MSQVNMYNTTMPNQIKDFDQRLQQEINKREAVQGGMLRIQSQIDQLARTIASNPVQSMSTLSTATNTTFTAQPPAYPPYLNTANGINMNNSTAPITHPSQYSAPPQPPVFQQMNPQLQINWLTSQMMALQEQFSASEKSFNIMCDDTENLKTQMNDRDQYDRRNNAILHGSKDVPIMPKKPTPEDTKVFTNYVVQKINELFPDIDGGFTARDIDDTHIYRTKKSRPNSHEQLIIIRFCSRLIRNEIFTKKKELKRHWICNY